MDQLGGNQHHIMDYLLGEVLERQPAELALLADPPRCGDL
jgi:ATP/maltotriose-dependent transcriptional regulator MalT